MTSSWAPPWRSFQRKTIQLYPVDTLQSRTDTHPHAQMGSAAQEAARQGPSSGAGRVPGGSPESPRCPRSTESLGQEGLKAGRTGSHSGLRIWEAPQGGRAGLGGMGAQERGPKLNQSALRSSRAQGVRGGRYTLRSKGHGGERSPERPSLPMFLPSEPPPMRGAGLLLLATSGGRHTPGKRL